jgi:hypothetical protein
LIGALKVDWYLVSDDFGSYLDANKLVDEAYKDQDSWAEKYCHLKEFLTLDRFLLLRKWDSSALIGLFKRIVMKFGISPTRSVFNIRNTESMVITGED